MFFYACSRIAQKIFMCISCASTEKHLWKITKQIILVIKNEVLVFVKTNYFKCLHFSRSQIKVYQISQTYSGTIRNSQDKIKTMVISSNTHSFFQKNWKSMEKGQFFNKDNGKTIIFKKNTIFQYEMTIFQYRIIIFQWKTNTNLFGSVYM